MTPTFPYPNHRNMAQVMADEAVDCEQIRSAVFDFFTDSAMKNAAPEGVGTACPEPDLSTSQGEVTG